MLRKNLVGVCFQFFNFSENGCRTRCFGKALWASWEALGSSWTGFELEASWSALGGLLGPLGALLEASWGLLGASWTILGRLGGDAKQDKNEEHF